MIQHSQRMCKCTATAEEEVTDRRIGKSEDGQWGVGLSAIERASTADHQGGLVSVQIDWRQRGHSAPYYMACTVSRPGFHYDAWVRG